MGGNYIFSGRASGWTMGVCISAVAHLWAAGVFSTEKRWGRRFWLDCAAARTTRPEPPRRPLRLACLARCLASEAICCTRQLARSLPRGHPAAGIFCARRWLFGFLTGPLCPHFLDHGHNILFGFNAKLLSNALEHFLALLQGSDRDICGTTPLLVGDCLFQASRELPHG